MPSFITLNPIDPGTDTRVTVRLCASQDPAHTGAAGQIWWPAIVVQPVLQSRFFDGDFTSGVDAGSASAEISLVVLQASGQFPRVERYDWAGATATIQRITTAGTLADVAVMRVESFASEQMRLALRLASSQDLLETDVLSATYAGTTGIEGGADLKGRVKPWVFGRAVNVEPVFIDQIDNVFQVSGYGPVQAISAVYERGASFGASIGNFASYAALVAANIPEGRWGTCLAQGLIRLGAPPAGVITCDVDGDNTDGFLRRTGAIIGSIAARRGLSANISAASLAALDAAVPRNVNIVLAEQISFLELVQRMVAPCNAVPGIDALGRLIASRVTIGTASITLDAQGREMPPVLGMARQNTSAPYKRIQIGAARSWRVHSLDEIAFFSDLIDRGAYDAATVYREGDIVTSPDKSRWLYVNLTPGSGNAPPTWPTASDAFWANLEPPLAPSAIGLEAGATRNVPRGTYDAGTTYVRGDSVLFAGSSYQLIVASSVGNAPPDALRWALLANGGSGPAGADGLPGLTINVTNESHSVSTEADGSGGDYSDAGGQFILRRGDTLLTPVFSIPARTPNTSWISIDAVTGVYTVTDPGVKDATATLRAVWAGIAYEKTYTLTQTRQGVTGPNLKISETAQAFTFTDGVASPSSQTITLTALLTNLTGTATWSVTPSVTLGGSGNTRTLSVADFGANRQVTVQATLGGITDRITIVRLERDAFGGNANRVPFSRIEGGRGWSSFLGTVASITPIFPNEFEGRRYIVANATASAAGQIASIAGTVPFPVQPGERLSIGLNLNVFETSGPPPAFWQVLIDYFLGDTSVPPAPVIFSESGNIGGDALRQGFVTVPVGVTRARLVLLAQSAGAGTFQLNILNPMVTSAATGQTAHPPFTPGPNAFDGATVGAPNGTFVGSVEASALVAQAATAASDATAANASAFAANTAISIITSDDFLSRDEKPEIRKQRTEIVAEYPTIRARAVALGVDVATFDTHYSDLIAYLDVLDLAGATDTFIIRSVFNARFTDYFAARQAVLDAIAAEAARRATWANVSGTGRPEDAADITRTISGPANITMQFRADLALLSPLPITVAYQLGVAGASALTSGVTWAVSVVSGSFAGDAPSIVGTGTGLLSINSAMTSPDATLRVTATTGGRTSPPFVVRVERNVAAPSLAPLTSINSASFAQAHDTPIQITLPSSASSVALTAVSDLFLGAAPPAGASIVEGKWQRETSPGTWADVGSAAASSPSPEVIETEIAPGEFVYSASPGSITCNRTATGLTPGAIYRFRFVARISGGNVVTVAFLGNASATA